MNKLLLLVLFLLVCSACGSGSPQATEAVLPSATSQPGGATPSPTQTLTQLAPTLTSPVQGVAGLSGKLILIVPGENGSALTLLDLASGDSRLLFQAASGSFLSAGIASPDGKQILLAYAAPPPGGKAGYGLTDLYLMPADGSAQPSPFLMRKDPQESFFSPAWSLDGKTIYYTHFFYTDPKAAAFQYQIERVGADKKPEILVKDALSPRISPDGLKLGFLAYDPVSKENELSLADADGKNPVPVIPKGTFPDVDSFNFSPDGRTIIFSAVNPATSSNFWWETLLGVQVAYAHDVSSDWYRVPISGGQVERLTNLNDTSYYGDFSPDGKQFAFICATGLFVMHPDGGQLTQISSSVQAGTVDWIP